MQRIAQRGWFISTIKTETELSTTESSDQSRHWPGLTRLLFVVIAAGMLCGPLAGCSDESSSTPVAPELTKAKSAGQPSLPTVSISTPHTEPALNSEPATITPASATAMAPTDPAAVEGSADWALKQILLTRMQSLPDTNDVNQLREFRRQRNQRIIDLATQAISQTHQDELKQNQFLDATHHLMEARLEMALQGQQEDIEKLYSDAASLLRRDKQSQAAADASFVLVRFANTNAQRFAQQEPQWIEEFVRQARMFSQNFPHEVQRAPSMLFIAGETCELQGMVDQAIACYTEIQEKYPQHPRSRQVTGIIRRLTLKGQVVELAGPTIDGGFLSIKDFRSQPVLVVFWSSQARPFVDQIARFQAIERKYRPQGLVILGINLDQEEPAVDAFLEQTGIGWRQIFFSDPGQRGWDNPVASHYSVRYLPTVWLVDREGIAVDVSSNLDQIEPQIEKLLAKP